LNKLKISEPENYENLKKEGRVVLLWIHRGLLGWKI
jgi:hypothetical protein